jgi:hypothetical protein
MLFDRHRTGPLCAVLASVALLLAGCGRKSTTAGSAATGTSPGATSSGTSTAAPSTSSSSPPGASAAAFIAQADPICRKANVLLAQSSAKGKNAAELAAAVIVNETVERKAATELAKLTPPSGLASVWVKMLNYRRELANALGNAAVAVKREAKASLPALTKAKKKLHRELSQTASSAGFKDCAKVG